jgi:TonB-dependent SusC/RagA subfamily outer membrane receptor
MKKLSQNCVLFLFFFFSFSLHSANNPVDFQKTVADRFNKFCLGYPQEKVYLHTDKPYYSAGEKLWFKGYLVNAVTHRPKSISEFIYVELISKSDSVFYRAKIKKDSLGFAGSFNLKPELPSGFYTLRAYTYWMQNATSDFFFNKIIYIGNVIDDATQSQITYGKPIDGKVTATLKLTNASKQSLPAQKVNIKQLWSKLPTKPLSFMTNSLGIISWLQTIDSTAHSKNNFELSIDNPGVKYKKIFYLPEFSSDFDVQFFPESGVFLSGNLQTIAFKAIGEDGLSVPVTGEVFNNKDEEVTNFSSINKGMGKFMLATRPNETYYAKVKTANGSEKRFQLPTTQTNGVSLHFVFNRDKILYEIINQTNIPNNNLYLLIHCRGNAILVQQLNVLSGKISDTYLPEGVLTFSVIDSVGNTLCERLCFLKQPNHPTLGMQSNKPVYDKRDSVNLSLTIKSLLEKTNITDLSISVTDSRTVIQDTLSDNILTNLLLTSDLKGYIEEPAAYFADNLNSTHEKLDILMLTQGWRRFKTPEIVKGKYEEPKYYIEAGQLLSGKVKNILNKPSKKCRVMALLPYSGSIVVTETDSVGRFLIDGIQFPDSTTLILRAKKTRALGEQEIIVDKDIFPKANTYIPSSFETTQLVPNEYLGQSKDKYYSEGGMRVVSLDEVTVKAAKINKNEVKEYYSGFEDSKVTAEQLDKYPGMTVLNLLQMLSGATVENEQVYFRGNRSPAMFLIDNIEVQPQFQQDITLLNSDEIESISIFKGASASIFGSRGGSGVVAIQLKRGYIRKTKDPISLVHATPLGFQKPSEFYVPKYDVDSIRKSPKADLRTTIYWNPKLLTDTAGNVTVKFFTADNVSKYSVVIEGVTKDGEICRYVGVLRRE